MKEYLTRCLGKKISVSAVGVAKEAHFEGTLKELVGDTAVLLTTDGLEIGIPIDKILLVGPPGTNSAGRTAGFIGD